MDGRVRKGWLGFTVRHNIRVVCVGSASGSALRTCLPLSPTPSTPPRRPSGASDWSTLFKMASSPHKIRFISIPGKETSPVLLMTRKNLRLARRFPERNNFSRRFQHRCSPSLIPVHLANRSKSSWLTLKGLRTVGAAFRGQHFPEAGFKLPPPSNGARVGAADGGDRRATGDHNVGSQEPWMFRGKLSLLYRGYIFIAMYYGPALVGRLGNVNPILASSV